MPVLPFLMASAFVITISINPQFISRNILRLLIGFMRKP